MAIKKYDFDYNYGEAYCSFEVDTEKFTPELANITLEFFDWHYDKDADPVDEVMKKYAMRAIKEATFNGHNTYGVIKDFEEAEGYGRIDGSIGITLISISEYEFEENDLEMKVS